MRKILFFMKKIMSIVFLLLSLNYLVFADNGKDNEQKASQSERPTADKNISLQGKVIDLITGEALAGAEICLVGTDIKVFTDLEGNFSIQQISPGNYNLICSLITYHKSLIENLQISDKENTLKIALEEIK